MGSGDWFKRIINLKKAKSSTNSKHAKTSASKWKGHQAKESTSLSNGKGSAIRNSGHPDVAATKIQTAFRAYKARKALRRLRGTVRLQALAQNFQVKKQSSSALSYLHSWSNVQAQIRARRLCMVTEGRIKQKKLENQLKLESKLHDLEVEWNGGSETMGEILARIYQREEAAVKRERAMAYAFSHQWRANPSQYYGLGKDELGKANWGWSWKERWIAARPWESRVPNPSASPKKAPCKPAIKFAKSINSATPRSSVSVKKPSSNGRGKIKPRRLSYPAAEKPGANEGSNNSEEGNAKKDQAAS